MEVFVAQLFLHESAEIGHIPLPPMAGVRRREGGKEGGGGVVAGSTAVAMETMSFPVRSYL